MGALPERARAAAGLLWINLDPSEGSKPSEGLVQNFKAELLTCQI